MTKQELIDTISTQPEGTDFVLMYAEKGTNPAVEGTCSWERLYYFSHYLNGWIEAILRESIRERVAEPKKKKEEIET